jgi:hypothetical protein
VLVVAVVVNIYTQQALVEMVEEDEVFSLLVEE